MSKADRKILKTNITLDQGIRQWGNLGGLVAGLFTEDYGLIGRSLKDHIIEPIRSILIPEFNTVKDGVQKAGALGFGISGSGPSMFALSKGEGMAQSVAETMNQIYAKTGLDFDIHISPIGTSGVQQI